MTLVNIRAYWRFFVVVRQFLPLLLAYARDRRRFFVVGGRRRVDAKTRRRRADRLLDSLLTLGPTFIKLGQLLSTRPDILPPEYIDVLSQLQDEVPPADWSAAREVVEAELGPVDEAFDDFDPDPISGASLGQVYTAAVDGDEVAVKVRRPNIEPLVESDLRVIRWSLPILLTFIDDSRSFSLENLADEFAKTIREEMDYEREAEMLREIRESFSGDDTVVIPPVVEDRSSPRVLTMEYTPGTKINDLEALEAREIDRTRLAENLQRAYLRMIIEDGVFHADPHPGNLAVTDEGRIIFYDFGMSGRVDEFLQDRIVDFYVAVANQDTDAILDALVEMGTLSPEADRQVMGEVMELAIQDVRGEDIEQYRVQQIVGQIEDSIYEFPFRLPKNLALVLRVATVVEGVCVTLDPEFDFITIATDYLTEQGYREESIRQYIDEAGDQVQESALATVRTPPKLESALDRIDRENFHLRAEIEDSNDVFDTLAKRIVYGLLLTAGVLSTAVLYSFATVRSTAVAAAFSFGVAVLLYRSLRERKGIRAKPQFTRQNLKERRRRESD